MYVCICGNAHVSIHQQEEDTGEEMIMWRGIGTLVCVAACVSTSVKRGGSVSGVNLYETVVCGGVAAMAWRSNSNNVAMAVT